jgi:hypothetical protein
MDPLEPGPDAAPFAGSEPDPGPRPGPPPQPYPPPRPYAPPPPLGLANPYASPPPVGPPPFAPPPFAPPCGAPPPLGPPPFAPPSAYAPPRACAPPAAEPPEPFTRQTVQGACRNPLRLVELVLVEPRRLGATIADAQWPSRLGVLLLGASVLLAIPLGLVLGPSQPWRVAVLLVGALLICLPSLYVFGAFLGSRLSFGQVACVTLVTTAVSALFTFGFFPIVWFLDATMIGSETVTSHHLAVLLLACSVLAGIWQLKIVLATVAERHQGRGRLVFLPWLALLLFIMFRLAHVLALV